MVEKIRPRAMISEAHNDDGWKTWDTIKYYCPTCGRSIRGYKSDNACDNCGTFYDWGDSEPKIVVIKSIKW